MTTSREIAERFWNLPQKGVEEERRERLFMDDILQKAHLDREIERCLPGCTDVASLDAYTELSCVPMSY